MEKVNLAEKLSKITNPWDPKIVGLLNGQEVRVAKLEGEFIWHSHVDADEFFLVLHGSLRLELPDQVVVLEPGEFFIVPRGVEHRPVAEEEVHCMLFEPAGTLNTGQIENERTKADLEHI